ncbi:MAG TPA: hypothetical protein VND87_12360 [Stellaceae bacterium]|nr:hypothetical protein [Stellaceae bacterium]
MNRVLKDEIEPADRPGHHLADQVQLAELLDPRCGALDLVAIEDKVGKGVAAALPHDRVDERKSRKAPLRRGRAQRGGITC